jgi:aspartate/methionine/tyrosine aminotransferase
VSLWELTPENGFKYDLDALEKLVTPKTKLIVANTPHNPTGAMLSEVDLRRIHDLAESVGAWLLVDEAYRWLDLPGGDPMAPPVRDLGPRGISVGTMSKPFGLPGLRIGWISAPEAIVTECWHARDYISLSPGKLNDYLAQIALNLRDKIVARNWEIVTENLRVADAWFEEHAELASWTRPRGGLLALMKYNFAVPSNEVADVLAADFSVMLAPGSAFGYEGYLRVGVGQRPDLFAEGLRRTAIAFEGLKAEAKG